MDTEGIRTEWEPASGSRLDQLLTNYDRAAERVRATIVKLNELREQADSLAKTPGLTARLERQEVIEQSQAVLTKLGQAGVVKFRRQSALQQALDHLNVPAAILRSYPHDLQRMQNWLAAAKARFEYDRAFSRELAKRNKHTRAVDGSVVPAAEQAVREVQTRRDKAEKELERRRAFWCGIEELDPRKTRGATRQHGRK